MTRRALILGALVVIVLVGVAVRVQMSIARRPADLTLRFEAVADGTPLVRNQFVYPNPGGEGQFGVRNFQFFISNVRLTSEAGDYVESASYHLARFDNEDASFTISLKEVVPRDYRQIELSIGVDEAANHSLASVGELDPNGRMAWAWESGYKFVLFEGGLQVNDLQIPLVYHVGFDENYTRMVFPEDSLTGSHRSAPLVFQVDMMALFRGTSTIDMKSLSNVKFDRADAKLLAANFANMITLSR